MTAYSINVDDQGHGTVTVTDGADVMHYSSHEPEFSRIVRGINEQLTFAEIKASLNSYNDIEQLSDRVSIADDHVVLFDDEPVEEAVVAQIKRYHNEGRDVNAILKFIVKTRDNVSRRSREHLFNWATSQGLRFTPTGNCLGWKSVYWSEGDCLSVHSGTAYVDGVLVNGHIPNKIGSVISMDRRDVQDDPTIDCSYGLHVGSESYARSFSGDALLLVEFDPADVVSVPRYDTNKMRVCKYTVVDVIRQPEWDDDADVDHEPEADVVNVEEALAQIPAPMRRRLIDRILGRNK